MSGSNLLASPTPSPPGLRSITFGDGKFVIVGDGGLILTSSGGANWATASCVTDEILTDVVWGRDSFVAVGGNGTILSSSDGLAWTKRFFQTNEVLNSVCYGDGLFLAAGRQSMLVSSNGIQWAELPEDPSPSEDVVAFGNDRFLSMGANTYFPGHMTSDSRRAWMSSNGRNWNQSPHPAPQQLRDTPEGMPGGILNLVFYEGQFWGLSTEGIFVSIDGRNWIATPDDPPGFRYCYYDMTFGTGRFVAARNPRAESTQFSGPVLNGSSLAVSKDGLTWTPGRAPFSKIVWGNFISDRKIMLSSGWGGSSIFLSSKDGKEWIIDGKNAFGGNVQGNQLVYANRKPGTELPVLNSTDGIIWKRFSASRKNQPQ
ncbi:MAG: hypothetical protein EXS24_00100 [Pedosphaera sp.]|nr:hypothetical protein [Pedosphaera sp.]